MTPVRYDAPRISYPATVSEAPLAAHSSTRKAQALDPLQMLIERPSNEMVGFTPYRDGNDDWSKRMDMIARARSSVVATTYVIEPDAYGLAYVDALISAARRGVTVVLTVDALGMIGLKKLGAKGPMYDALQSKLEALQDAGGSVGWTGTFGEQTRGPGHGVHFKGMVVDGAEALMGGRNIGEHYVKDWSDFSFSVKGPVVSAIAAACLRIARDAKTRTDSQRHAKTKHRSEALDILTALQVARAQKDDKLRAQGRYMGEACRFVLGVPSHGRNQLRERLLAEIAAAKESIVISSNNFNAHPELLALLKEKAESGVSVSIVTSSMESTPFSALGYFNSARMFPELARSGIKIYLTRERMEHGKMYLFDGKRAASGSYNMELSADAKLVEGLLFTGSQAMVTAVSAALTETMGEARSQRWDPTMMQTTAEPSAIQKLVIRLFRRAL